MSRTKGYKCFNIKCGSCIGKTLCGEPEDTALVCVDRVIGKPMTNADRIRAMSDKELGVWICKHALSCGCCVGVELCRSDDGIANGAVKWLQQPAEEDGHDERKENENV